MDGYLTLVRAQPLAMAMLQFAVLGTLGDLLGAWLAARRVHWPLGGGLWWRKMAKWALLAVPIKVAFVGFAGFTEALVAHGWLPQGQPLVLALATSVAINLQFGPLLVLGHLWLNNRISGTSGTSGWQHIDRAAHRRSILSRAQCRSRVHVVFGHRPGLGLGARARRHLCAAAGLAHRPGGAVVGGAGVDSGHVQPGAPAPGGGGLSLIIQ